MSPVQLRQWSAMQDIDDAPTPPFLRPANVEPQFILKRPHGSLTHLLSGSTPAGDSSRYARCHLFVRGAAGLATIVDWPTIITCSGTVKECGRADGQQ
jgi:hypothetical protein